MMIHGGDGTQIIIVKVSTIPICLEENWLRIIIMISAPSPKYVLQIAQLKTTPNRYPGQK